MSRVPQPRILTHETAELRNIIVESLEGQCATTAAKISAEFQALVEKERRRHAAQTEAAKLSEDRRQEVLYQVMSPQDIIRHNLERASQQVGYLQNMLHGAYKARKWVKEADAQARVLGKDLSHDDARRLLRMRYVVNYLDWNKMQAEAERYADQAVGTFNARLAQPPRGT